MPVGRLGITPGRMVGADPGPGIAQTGQTAQTGIVAAAATAGAGECGHLLGKVDSGEGVDRHQHAAGQ